MGIYNISMGKGIITSFGVLEKLFENELTEEFIVSHRGDMCQTLDSLAKKRLGKDYSVIFLGHDAFSSRRGNMDILANSEDFELQKQLDSISYWKQKHQEGKGNNHFFNSFVLCFIGICDEIESTGGEFGYLVKTPELLYGLPALLPSIIKLYIRLEAEKCEELSKFYPGLTPRIWTFGGDCHCCT